jgi:hypothetical protein
MSYCCSQERNMKAWRLYLVLIAAIIDFSLPAIGQAVVSQPPGVVIDHSSDPAHIYFGSPSLAVLSNGDYVASHDLFGPASTEYSVAVTRVFRSSDRGNSWRHLANVQGAFWSTLFAHRQALYLLGTYKHYGATVIHRSNDGGRTWTTPKNAHTGLLAEGRYHCATVPVLEHNGRLWRGMECLPLPPGEGGIPDLCASVMSAPVDADLLEAKNWSTTNKIPFDKQWTGRGWLEGNVVLGPQGHLVELLRVQRPAHEKAALLHVSDDGRKLSFDPQRGFIDFPGGNNKFTIRYDPPTHRYWSLANKQTNPTAFRNVLALTSSADLRTWRVEATLLEHPDSQHHAWQYVDWLFDGPDIIAASRTAWDESHSAHDADYFTFHRFKNFRTRRVE